MKNLKVSEKFKEITTLIFASIIPTVVNFCIIKIFASALDDEIINLISVIATSSITLFAILAYYHILSTNKRFRIYREYEGRWLQIIPESDYNVSVLELKYLKQSHQYVLTGLNFNQDSNSSISFIANKFVKRDNNDGFYYITNYTFQHRNSLGKIGFINDNVDNLTRAEGYFFDASTERCSRRYNTIMIKCDKKFFSYIKPSYTEIDFEKLPAQTIAEISRKFVKTECKIYMEQMNELQEREKCRDNCRNNVCKKIKRQKSQGYKGSGKSYIKKHH